MKSMEIRLRKLEQSQPAPLPPLVKQWLGQPLTDAEQAALEYDKAGIDPAWDEPDYSDMDAETRAWLMQGDEGIYDARH